MNNPKTHDALFKWLISAFTRDFFAHYFPSVRIGEYAFLDKEFIRKYEALKESLRGDLFLVMEVDIDGELQEIVIRIEHQANREDVGERMYEYACYAWLLRKRPVWSVVVYTDDAIWRKPVSDRFWHAFDSQSGKQWHRFDVIKIKAEKSRDLIRQHSLLCKMLALKADDRDIAREELVREIYRAAAAMKDQFTKDRRLLLKRWIDTYSNMSAPALNTIKKEISMDYIATTISEHIFLEGKAEGEAKGEAKGIAKGEAKGKAEGQLELLEMLYDNGILSKKQYQRMARPLRKQLKELTSAEEQASLPAKEEVEQNQMQ